MTALNVAALRAKLQELKGKGGNSEFSLKYYSAPEYDEANPLRSTIRILPGKLNIETNEQEPFFVETLLYRINNKNLHSPKIVGKPDPIWDYIRFLWKTNDDANIKIAREIKPKKRYYMNVVARERTVLNQEAQREETRKNDGPLIFSCGVKIFERILKAMVDEEEYGDITDLKEGYDFRVIKETRGEFPNYDDSKPCKKASPAGTNEEIVRWMSNLHDLKALITIPTYEELEHELKVYRGEIKEEAAGSTNETAAPAAERKAETTAPAAAPAQAAGQAPSADEDNFLAALLRAQRGE